MREFLRKSGILVWVIAAIILASVLGSIRIGGNHLIPVGVGRVFATFSDIFSQFLSFAIPLIIIGLVTPAIADLGRGGREVAGHYDRVCLRIDPVLRLPHVPRVLLALPTPARVDSTVERGQAG